VTPGVVGVDTPTPIQAAFTTRLGGVSAAPFATLNLGATVGDRQDDVAANRASLCVALGLDAERVVMGNQVHGALVREVDGASPGGRFAAADHGWPDGDGLATSTPGVALVVLGADCLPVVMWRTDTPRVAAAHAGWRGLVAGMLENAVAVLGDPSQTAVAIGPGIGPCCYEVSPEIRQTFADRFGRATVDGSAVDLALAARAALTGAGVGEGAITTLDTCTRCDSERWFSYRRDGAACGRQAGVIWIAP
jgi:polyphenol oxidase